MDKHLIEIVSEKFCKILPFSPKFQGVFSPHTYKPVTILKTAVKYFSNRRCTFYSFLKKYIFLPPSIKECSDTDTRHLQAARVLNIENGTQ